MEGERSSAGRGLQFLPPRSRPRRATPRRRRCRGWSTALRRSRSCPRSRCPAVIAPKKAVRKIASPRPRTHSGSATCADTNSVVIMTIHDAPARRLAAIARRGSLAAPYMASAATVPRLARIARPIGPQALLQPIEPERADDRPQPDHAEKHAVDRRPVVHLRTRDQRKKRPIGAGEQEEGDGADQRRVHRAVVANVAEPGLAPRWRGVRPEASPGSGAERATTRPPRQARGCRDNSTRRESRCRTPRWSNPPIAGPIARLTLKLALLIAMALSRSSLGTSIGVTSSHAGAASAPAAPRAKVVARRPAGVARRRDTTAAKAIEIALTASCAPSKSRRASTMSANAPAGRVSRNIGKRGRDLDRRHHHRVGIEAGHQPAGRGVEHRNADVRQRSSQSG